MSAIKMNDSKRLRRRRRRSPETLQQTPSLPSPTSESDSSLKYTDDPPPLRRRRRTRSKYTSDPSSLLDEANEVDSAQHLDFLLSRDQITSPALINTLDQISTELGEERRNDLDSEYWDDTHDWGSEYNTDYWHFLGQYE